jgi:dihydropteroate synthase
MALWITSRFDLDLAQPRVMGIVNVTPDSFFDGGAHATVDAARAHCDALVAEGAHILDIGGESTRPGAAAPTLQQELDRVLPVLRHAVTLGVAVSVDTSQPEVMQAALDSGADIVNDVRALTVPGAARVCAAHPRAGLCLMHMQGTPGSMQSAPQYGDVLADVAAFLSERRRALLELGVHPGRIALDPGIGFGKTVEHNLALLRRQRELLALGSPLLVGWSRKSTLGHLTGRPVGERLAASVAAALLAAERGASVLRVHDVAATVDALKIRAAIQDNSQNTSQETSP